MGDKATCDAQCRDVFVPDAYIHGEPAEPFIKLIRTGFTVLQCGIAAGRTKSWIDPMKQVEKPLGPINQYFEKQPEDIEAEYDALVTDALELPKRFMIPRTNITCACSRPRLRGGGRATLPARSVFHRHRNTGHQGFAQADRRDRSGQRRRLNLPGSAGQPPDVGSRPSPCPSPMTNPQETIMESGWLRRKK